MSMKLFMERSQCLAFGSEALLGLLRSRETLALIIYTALIRTQPIFDCPRSLKVKMLLFICWDFVLLLVEGQIPK